MVALVVAGAVAARDFFGVPVPGVAGARPRFLLQAVAVISVLLLSLRAFTLFVQHNPNVWQARWGVYLAFIVGVTQFAFIIGGHKKVRHDRTAAGLSGSAGPERASNFCSGCGTRALAGDNFCQQCGAPVKTEPEAIGGTAPPAAGQPATRTLS